MTSRPKLAEPQELKWPCISTEEEEPLVEILEGIFSKFAPCLRTVRKENVKKKRKDDSDKEQGIADDKLTPEEEEQRKTIKSQFVVGMQSVIRGLERDRLQAVLLWKDLEPAVLRKALLHLTFQHQCPVVCVSDILTPLKKSWNGLSSAATLGVVKSDDQNIFDELVKKVTALSPWKPVVRSSVPEISCTASNQEETVHNENELAIGKGGQVQIAEGKTGQSCSEQRHDRVTSLTRGEKPGQKLNNSVSQDNSKNYYIYKSLPQESSSTSKSFSGQSFIAFDTYSAESLCTSVQFSKGVRIKQDTEAKTSRSFGISPARWQIEDADVAKQTIEKIMTFAPGARQGDMSLSKTLKEDDYKPMNVKRLKINTEKKPKPKKKKKGK